MMETLMDQTKYRAATQTMALNFLDSVRRDIGDPAYWDAIWTNVNFPKQGVCHLHDWCDANMNMMDTIAQFMPSAHSAYWNRSEGGTDVDHIELHYESIWNDVYSESFVVMQEESKGFETIGACTTCGSNIVGPPEMKFTHNFCGAHE